MITLQAFILKRLQLIDDSGLLPMLVHLSITETTSHNTQMWDVHLDMQALCAC